MQNNFWKTLSVILIVVLVVGAVIVFWKNPQLSPKTPNYPYYTKAEVDAKLSGINNQINFLLRRTDCANAVYLDSSEEISLAGRTISAIVSSSTSVKFTVDGMTMETMNEGEIGPLPGTTTGEYLEVINIDYESYSGGLHRVFFRINC